VRFYQYLVKVLSEHPSLPIHQQLVYQKGTHFYLSHKFRAYGWKTVDYW